MEYKCGSDNCAHIFEQFRSVIEHRVEKHSDEKIQVQKLTVNAQTSQYQWNVLKYNIVPNQGLVVVDGQNQKVRF